MTCAQLLVAAIVLLACRYSVSLSAANGRGPATASSDIALYTALPGLVEDFVLFGSVEAEIEGAMTILQVAGDEALDRYRLPARRIIGSGDDQDWQIERDTRFVLGEPDVGPSLFKNFLLFTLTIISVTQLPGLKSVCDANVGERNVLSGASVLQEATREEAGEVDRNRSM